MRSTNQSPREPSQGALAVVRAPMLVWGGDAQAPPAHSNIVVWDGPGVRSGVRSIAALIETQADEVRRRYLAWAYDLGELRVHGRPMRERFTSGGSTSMWAQSLFVEQSMWKQHSLEPIVKLIGLELLLDRERPAELEFAGSDRDLHRVLKRLCACREIAYSWTKLPEAQTSESQSFLQRLPRFLQGLMAIGYLTGRRWALRAARPPGMSASGAPRVLICGPLFDPGGRDMDVPPFRPQFWTGLPAVLVAGGYQLHWLHYFYEHQRVPNVGAARRILKRLNASSSGGETHSLVDSRVTPAQFAKVFARWLKISVESLLVGWTLRRRFAESPRESYWPLLRDDWARNFRGYGCVENLMFAEWFEDALQGLPRQDECIYLMENQSWEKALARAWYRHGHGRLTGVAHSTTRYWDLRYHCDPRQYESGYRRQVPGPQAVALNGAAARAQYLATCATREQIFDCEALRYLHLKPGTPRSLSTATGAETLQLLILGDYTAPRTHSMLSLVETACTSISVPIDISVKAHPACPVDAAAYPGFAFRIVEGAIADLVSSAHVVLASNTTSASVDAHVSGARVLVHDDQHGVNVSPLRGVAGIRFIREPVDLAAALELLGRSAGGPPHEAHAFFNIDPALRAWRRYFGILHSEVKS